MIFTINASEEQISNYRSAVALVCPIQHPNSSPMIHVLASMLLVSLPCCDVVPVSSSSPTLCLCFLEHPGKEMNPTTRNSITISSGFGALTLIGLLYFLWIRWQRHKRRERMARRPSITPWYSDTVRPTRTSLSLPADQIDPFWVTYTQPRVEGFNSRENALTGRGSNEATDGLDPLHHNRPFLMPSVAPTMLTNAESLPDYKSFATAPPEYWPDGR
jgi:hypothetical protein